MASERMNSADEATYGSFATVKTTSEAVPRSSVGVKLLVVCAVCAMVGTFAVGRGAARSAEVAEVTDLFSEGCAVECENNLGCHAHVQRCEACDTTPNPECRSCLVSTEGKCGICYDCQVNAHDDMNDETVDDEGWLRKDGSGGWMVGTRRATESFSAECVDECFNNRGCHAMINNCEACDEAADAFGCRDCIAATDGNCALCYDCQVSLHDDGDTETPLPTEGWARIDGSGGWLVGVRRAGKASAAVSASGASGGAGVRLAAAFSPECADECLNNIGCHAHINNCEACDVAADAFGCRECIAATDGNCALCYDCQVSLRDDGDPDTPLPTEGWARGDGSGGWLIGTRRAGADGPAPEA